MYNAIIFGTGSASIKLIKVLDFNKVNIVAYVDNDQLKQNTEFNGKRVIQANQLKNYKYDFIIISSMYCDEIENQLISFGVDRNKIISYLDNSSIVDFHSFSGANIFNIKLQQFLNLKNVELIVSGLSYSMYGIDTDHFNKSSFNFSISNQDLFYDYNIVKYLSENHSDKFKSIKYLIIGISYYSFGYDLSKTINSTNMYYPALKTMHNDKNKTKVERNYYNYSRIMEFIIKDYMQIEDVEKLNRFFKFDLNEYIKDRIAICKLFNKDNINNIDDINDKVFEVLVSDYNSQIRMHENIFNNMNDLYKKYGKTLAIKNSKNNYEESIIENKKIFESYIQLLNKNNIKTIVAVFPTSKYYYRYFSEETKTKFYEIINEFNKQYDFQFMDYFNSNLFTDEDFFDSSHLNSRGAIKMTKLLNEHIKW
jgi:hypothetical protein